MVVQTLHLFQRVASNLESANKKHQAENRGEVRLDKKVGDRKVLIGDDARMVVAVVRFVCDETRVVKRRVVNDPVSSRKEHVHHDANDGQLGHELKRIELTNKARQ